MKGIKIHTIEGGTMPQRQTKQAVGYDCFVRKTEINDRGQLVCFLGFTIDIPEGVAALIVPRSSIVKTGYRLSNCIGIGDPDFKCEYKAVFDIVSASKWDAFKEKGCCQLIFVPALFAENDNVTQVERVGGYGSTDKH